MTAIAAILGIYFALFPMNRKTNLLKTGGGTGKPLCKSIFLCISVLKVASGPRMKLASCNRALISPIVCSTDRSKAVVPVLVFFVFALWCSLRGDLF